jgi:hypothetical protein
MTTVASPRTELQHLVSSVFFDERGLMGFVTVHFDDSGTDPKSHIAIAACYVSTADQWNRFENEWRGFAKQFGFTKFHMAEFASGNGEFYRWDDAKRKEVIGKLCATINVRIRTGFFAAINKQDYDDIVPADWFRSYLGKYHYTFAVRCCATQLGMWREQFEPSSSMHYVFDQMTKGEAKSEVIKVMDAARDASESAGKYYGNGIIPLGGYSFEDKAKVLPLQASDILAWCGFQYLRLLSTNQPLHWIAKEALTILKDAPIKNCVFTKQKLKEWAAEEREAVEKNMKNREYRAFTKLADRLLTVSHGVIKERLDEEKQMKKRKKSKASSASHA